VSFPELGITPRTKSLGWGIIDLANEDLKVPTGLGAGQPFTLTGEQEDLIVAWYALDDKGHFIYRRAIWRFAKGWGKSPLAGLIGYAELVGDVVFDGWDSDRRPVGRPHPSPWIQFAAVSEDQTDNTYLQLLEMLRDSPAVDGHRLDVGQTRITFRNRPGRLEPVTSASGSREGTPITFAHLDQTESWMRSNGGKALAATIRRNVAKIGGRSIETPNAFAPGEGSVAEVSHEAVKSGRAAGVLYVAREAPETPDLSDKKALRKALRQVYGESRWAPIDRLVAEIQDPASDDSASRRWYLNQITSPEEAIVDIVVWNQLANADLQLTQGETLALGFDGSDVGDATALYACRWPDWAIFCLGVWERPENSKGDWKVDRKEVSDAVANVCTRFHVVRGYFDDSGWQSEIDEWTAEFGQAVVRYPHRSDARIGPASERFATMTTQRTLRHTGEPILTRHLANGRRALLRNADRTGWWRPVRKHQSWPIDAASAAIGAVAALGDAVAHGEVAEQVDPVSQVF
jgi:hypothetical protein